MDIEDEDSGEPVACPFCESIEECEHLLLVWDRSFSGATLGFAAEPIDALITLLTDSFAKLLAREDRNRLRIEDPSLAELWQESLNEVDPAEPDVSLSGAAFNDFVTELFVNAGADEAPGSPVSDGGPGMSSSYTVLWAENPAVVFETARITLGRSLKKAARSTRDRR